MSSARPSTVSSAATSAGPIRASSSASRFPPASSRRCCGNKPAQAALVLTLPNLITVARVLLIPVVAFLLLDHDYKLAFAVFVAAALGDWLDGFLARRLNQMSQLGAVLDPIADKMTMMIVAILLAAQEMLPIWLAVVIVMRDAIIVAGAVAYRFVVGHIEMAPTRLSKANTFLEFGVLALVMARAGRLIETGAWLIPLFVLLFASVLVSGAHYVWVWRRKALDNAPPR
ncbi:MAG: CDP-alcohol phosphatidyltransferase family protein [Rhodocyclaceae bacterium]|nr:MAG: CDP-alcohol phosphatidyltransferase family protein [Rhodocyclaceae bacterium]